MYGLTNEEKLKLVKKFSEELEVTAYEFGNNTELSDIGASNILSGESKKPRTKTLNIMLKYLESKKSGIPYIIKESELQKSEEPPEDYNTSLEDIIFNKMYAKLKPDFDDITKKLTSLRMDLKRLHENQVEIKKNINKNKGGSSSQSS